MEVKSWATKYGVLLLLKDDMNLIWNYGSEKLGHQIWCFIAFERRMQYLMN